MIDIIIKSFNRPHYLDRCLSSIIQNVSGYDKIIVLDDGTPEKYLLKIKNKFPDIEINTSAQYNLKSKSIENHTFDQDKLNGFTIPTDLWFNTVKDSDEYVLVTEDDVWFTDKIDLKNLVVSMSQFNVELCKLGWLGNNSDDSNLIRQDLTENIETIVPRKLFTSSTFLMDWFMFNRYKFFSLLYYLKLVDNNTKRSYWILNSILMGLYHKDYWLFMWKDSVNKLDEKIQLKNAAVYYHKNKKNKNLIGRTKSEVMKTTFKSTASGVYHDYQGIHLDINRVNHILNEA